MSPILRELKKGSCTPILFFRAYIFFFDSGTFAQEIIPVLRSKNRALRLTTLYLILTQIRFLIKIDLYCRYLGVDKNPMLVYLKFSLVPP